MSEKSWTACEIAPEDLRPGIYIIKLRALVRHTSLCRNSDGTIGARVVQQEVVPAEGELLLRVVDVCLPYVLGREPGGHHHLLDVRNYRLARVAARFGRRAFKHLSPPSGSCAARAG